MNISEPAAGLYRFIVHYYLDTYDEGLFGEGSGSVSTNVTVKVLSFGQPIATFGPVLLDQTNRNWDVFELEWFDVNTPPTIIELGNTYLVSSSAVKACMSFFP